MKILLVDYGSIYFKNIKQSLDKLNVKYIEINHDESLINFDQSDVVGIILSGGPGRVNNPDDPQLNPDVLEQEIPILGICYGMQVLVKHLGGKVESLSKRDLGISKMRIEKQSILNKDIIQDCDVHMAHFDHITEVPDSFDILARTNISIAMIENKTKDIYAVQYHPEATKTINDMKLFKNFIFDICKYS